MFIYSGVVPIVYAGMYDQLRFSGMVFFLCSAQDTTGAEF